MAIAIGTRRTQGNRRRTVGRSVLAIGSVGPTFILRLPSSQEGLKQSGGPQSDFVGPPIGPYPIEYGSVLLFLQESLVDL